LVVELFGSSAEEILSVFIGYLTFAIDIMAAIIVGIIIVIAFISALRLLRKPTPERTLAAETVRLGLARGLLLVLDFVVASDILKTILVPSITELTLLAFIVAVRIALSWSLSKELDRHTTHLKQ
jgi:uncharacterized membrane protein